MTVQLFDDEQVRHSPREIFGELIQMTTLTRLKSMAPKWTDVTRRNRWIRAYLVNAACVLASLTQIIYAHLGCPVGYSVLFRGVNDPLKVVEAGIAVCLSAMLINGYGVGLCWLLAKRNGQWSGGVLAYHVHVFLVVSIALCFALIIVSSTTLHMALGLRVNKDVFERSMRLYLNRIAVKKIFDKIQNELHCCGSRRYDDWFDIPWAQSSLLVSGEYVGFPVSCCNKKIIQTGMKCISTAKKDRIGDLQPYLDGCHESMRRHIRSSMMILSLISMPMTIAFCWNTLNIFRTVTSRPRTSRDDVTEQRMREMAARRRAEMIRLTARRRVELMRLHDELREDHRKERLAAEKRSVLVSRALEQDRLRRDAAERDQRDAERVLRAPLEKALIKEQRAWEREASQKYQEEQRRLVDQERMVVEEQERKINALALMMRQLKEQEQLILMDEQRQLKLLLPKTSSSLLLHKDDA